MKIRANGFDLIDAERFDSFSSVIINCKNKYCCFNKKLNNTGFNKLINCINKKLIAFY